MGGTPDFSFPWLLLIIFTEAVGFFLLYQFPPAWEEDTLA